MFKISDRTSDEIVRFLSAEAERLEGIAKHRDLRGPENAEDRKRLRDMAHEFHCAVAGLNTGEGVTRRSATISNGERRRLEGTGANVKPRASDQRIPR